tara:strand:- start:383 stop:601 length:219 start_codon:yes stop_codon:yes gene_type:complete
MNTEMKYYEDQEKPIIQLKIDRVNEIEVYLMEIGIVTHKDGHYNRVLNQCINYWKNKIKYIEEEIISLKLKE